MLFYNYFWEFEMVKIDSKNSLYVGIVVFTSQKSLTVGHNNRLWLSAK